MSRKHFIAFMPAALIFCLALCATATAAEIVLNPIADIWLRECMPDSVYDADFVSVWAPNVSSGPGTDGDNARYGVLSFNLSGITKPIASARLELYLVDYWRNTVDPIRQSAYLVTPVVSDDNTLTWNSYHGTYPVETQLAGLGVYDLPVGTAVSQTYISTATAADVALLEAQRAAGKATFVFKPNSLEEEVTTIQGRHDWADMNASDQAPTITINGVQITASVDTWVRETSPASTFENDDISVWHSEREGPGQRVGILEFDLSSFEDEITSASMSLFSLASSAAGEVFEQNAKLLAVSSAPLTWNDYAAAGASTLEGFGHYSLASDAPTGAYIDSDVASADDLVALEAARLNGGKLIFALESVPHEVTYVDVTPSSCDWADSESTYAGYGLPPAGNPQIWPRLIIEEVPEPSTLLLLVLGMVTLMAVRRK